MINNLPTIIITGASGFIGNIFLRIFKKNSTLLLLHVGRVLRQMYLFMQILNGFNGILQIQKC